MADTTLSGYKAAATAIAWTSGQALNSLSNNEWTDLSDEIDNSTNKYMLYDLEIYLASAAFTGATSRVDIYLLASVDGTNYPNWTGNVTTAEPENEQYRVDTVFTSQATEAQRMVSLRIPVPNGKHKFAFRNRTGVALAASANTAKYRPHQFAS